ncbi:MAG: CusA/CzcA family heavy metal efflux RND transporter [Flavobacteriales bacterium]
MIYKIAAFSVHNKLIVALGTLALLVWGIFELRRLPVDAVPDITDDQVQILTVSPSLGATDVERLITFPVELACSNAPRVKQVRSFSRFGLSVVTVVFEEGTDIYWARQQLSERLVQVQASIPPGLGVPRLGPVSSGLGEIYQYVVRCKDGYEGRYSPAQLRSIQDWVVRRQLLSVKGIADVSSFGGLLKEYEVQLQPAQMKAYKVTASEIAAVLNANNENAGGSYIETGPTLSYIRSEGLMQTKSDIENTVLRHTENGLPVKVKDVAVVGEGHAIPYGALCYNGDCNVSGAVVMMLRGENSSAVIARVKDKVKDIQKMLPEGVVIEPFLDRSKMVDHAISTVKTNLLEGAAIVLLVLFLFLGDLRAAFIVASVIPLAMLFAIGLMNLFGVSGNLMSLGALDFGLLIDGAVIIVEAILFYFMQHRNETVDKDALTADIAGKMLRAAIFGQLIILVVYLPIFSLQGVEGKMFRPMAQTVSFALVGAFMLSLTYVPMMSAWLLKIPAPGRKNFADRWEHFLQEKYSRILTKAIRHKKMVLSLALLLFIPAAASLFFIGGEFIPQLEEGDFAVETRLLPGASLHTTQEHTSKASQVLLKFPEVEKVVTKIGSSEIPTDPLPLEIADMIVVLKDKKEWTTAHSFAALADTMNRALSLNPGATFSFQFPVQMRFNELLTGAKQDVVCKIFGEDLDSLVKYADHLRSIIENTEGAADIYVESVSGMPQTLIRYNYAALAAYGVQVSELNRAVEAAFSGTKAGQIYEGEKSYDIVLRLPPDIRNSAASLRQLPVQTASGSVVPLEMLADIREISGYNQVQRENTQRRIIIGFNVKDRDVQSVVKDIQAQAASLALPSGYYIRYGGSFENLQEASARLSIALPVALGLIFVLLFFAFGSAAQSLRVYSAIPLSSIGGIAALWLRGMPFSISAGIGFIALFGVAVLNGVVLVSEINKLRAERRDEAMSAIVMQACINRLRPVLLTATVASLGFLPMALSNGAGAEVQRPLATVVIGGLISSTLLTLLVLPVLFLLRKAASPKAALVLLLFGITGYAAAQVPVHYHEALRIMQDSSHRFRALDLEQQGIAARRGTGWNLPKTQFNFSYGNINSAAVDNGFQLQQSLEFPTVYTAQSRLLKSEQQGAYADNALSRREKERELSLHFWKYLWIQQKIARARQKDSLLQVFSAAAQTRARTGETGLWEEKSAQNEQLLVRQELLNLRNDSDLTLQLFNSLLQTDTYFIPATDSMLAPLHQSRAGTHPLLLKASALENSALYQWRVRKSKVLPDILLGYNNMTIIGYQNPDGNEVYFDGRKRFGTFVAGLALPLFSGAAIQEARAARFRYQGVQALNRSVQAEFNARYSTAARRTDRLRASMDTYRNELMPAAAEMEKIAFSQWKNGAISYSEWFLMYRNCLSIYDSWLDLLWEYNAAVIEYNYLNP